ncbi:hypothetical protein [Methylotenera sp. L2L1]|uniref:hypothetical protein n=1 Tax=Methylotenera sp. L2L1 TaxID=1502770 RepID=UPI0005635715|nr:hypothetical protein [Methylotenera sp. L2L1]
MSKLGLSFIALYVAISATVVSLAIQSTTHFNNLAVALYFPVAFVPRELSPSIPKANYDLYSGKERFLIDLALSYPLGMAFMCVFLYALGWSISNAFKTNTKFGYKFTAILLTSYAVGCFVFSKWFILSWPLFIVAGCFASWRTSTKLALTHHSSGTG